MGHSVCATERNESSTGRLETSPPEHQSPVSPKQDSISTPSGDAFIDKDLCDIMLRPMREVQGAQKRQRNKDSRLDPGNHCITGEVFLQAITSENERKRKEIEEKEEKRREKARLAAEKKRKIEEKKEKTRKENKEKKKREKEEIKETKSWSCRCLPCRCGLIFLHKVRQSLR